MTPDDLIKLGGVKIKHYKFDQTAVIFTMALGLSIPKTDNRAARLAAVDVARDIQERFPEIITAFQKFNAKRTSPIEGDNFMAYQRDHIEIRNPATQQAAVHFSDPDIPPRAAATMLMGSTEDQERIPLSSFFAHVPLEWFAANASEWIGLVLDWCNRLKPNKGISGIAPTTEYGMLRNRYRETWPLFARFPGFFHAHPFFTAARVSDKVGDINWLTILDDDLVNSLGGRDALAKALGPTITLHDWDGGILIQAGALPELGDRNTGVWPEDYRIVSNALKPIRYKEIKNTPMALFKVPEPLDPYEETLKWVNRFDIEES